MVAVVAAVTEQQAVLRSPAAADQTHVLVHLAGIREGTESMNWNQTHVLVHLAGINMGS